MSHLPQSCPRCTHATGGCTGACVQLGGPVWTLPPKGCICPPGSEKTCERSDCGRKDVFSALTAQSALKHKDDSQ